MTIDSNRTLIIDTPEGITAYRLLALRGALKLEIMGMRRRGRSAYAIIKEEFGLKGNKQRVLEQYEALLKESGIIR